MIGKYGHLLEAHIEKFVLVLVSLVCLWLFATRVLISPNKVEFGRPAQKFAPVDIDRYIKNQADKVATNLLLPSEPLTEYESRIGEFEESMDVAIVGVDITVVADLPPSVRPNIMDDRQYKLPVVAAVRNVMAEHYRAVVYEPTVEINEENRYGSSNSEPNDLDMVTVAAEFEIADLYESFYDCFAGVDVPEEWQDPCLAKPVFASVQMQRQELLDDGGWSRWQVVPRTRIESRREMFKLPDDASELSAGGIKMSLFKFDDRTVTMDVLQAEPYRVASEEEEWYPPSLYRKYKEYRKKLDADEKKKAADEDKDRRDPRRGEGTRGGRGGRLTPGMGGEGESRTGESRYSRGGMGTRDRRRRGPFPGGGRGMEEDRSRPGERDTSKKKKKTDLDEIEDEMEKIVITEKTDLAKMREPITFWAHDDTVEPGKSYRYRIRLGVFNPVAGTGQVKPADQSRQKDVILWSKLSDETKPIEIPEKLYFFPLNGDALNKAVTVKISKYVMGYWHGWQGTVRQGGVVGKEVENKQAEKATYASKTSGAVPDTIDYSTGAVLVDVKTVSSWSGIKNLTQKYHSDMLYTADGDGLERMPIQQLYWPRELQTKYQALDKLEKMEHKPFRAWTGSTGRFGRKQRRRQTRVDEVDEEEGGEDSAEADAHRRMFGE